MFDANMRYIPKGRVFFAKVHWIDKGIGFDLFDVKEGDILKCEMLNDDNENARVKFIFDKGSFEISNDCDDNDGFIVYEGNIDGTGFIDKKSKRIAMNMIKE